MRHFTGPAEFKVADIETKADLPGRFPQEETDEVFSREKTPTTDELRTKTLRLLTELQEDA